MSDGKAKPSDVAETLEQQNAGDPRHVGEILVERGRVKPQDVVDALNVQQQARGQSASDSTIRVDVGQLDRLMNRVGELVLLRNQIVQYTNSIEDSELLGSSQRLNLLTTELQESVMKTRRQPIGNVWSKFPRTVRDVAVACGKQVRVEMEGKDTELDKTIIEAIKDPLTHLVRNAVDHGTSDYMTKPTNSESLTSAMQQVRGDLIAKVIGLGPRTFGFVAPARSSAPRTSIDRQIEVLAIGTSTGGPNALAELIPRLPEDFPVPTVIVQHMPPLFTRLLAERLNTQSKLAVHEAEAGKVVEAGQVWVARGDYHMPLSRRGTRVLLNLNQDAPENSCRPAVDVLFRSVAQTYGPHVLAVVMTGMGSDGARGAAHIRDAGGEVLVQDEPSSVVWGMPGAVVSSGLADKICPLREIGGEIVRRVKASRTRVGVVAACQIAFSV